MKRSLSYAIFPLLLLAGISAAGGDHPLVDAVKKADKAAVRTLLSHRVNVNAAEPDGTTALHWAARANDAETADLLVRAGANVKAANRYGVTPLTLAAMTGNGVIVETLLKAGADPNTAMLDGETALMTAARTGKADAVKALLAHGADPNAKEKDRGQTALMWAAAEGNADAIRALVDGGADIRARSTGDGGFTALLFAAREGRIAAAKALLQGGADINESLQPPARGRRGAGPAADAPAAAGQRGGASAPAVMEPVLTANALLLAAANQHYELALALVDAGADPNSGPQGFTALHQVSWLRKVGDGERANPDGSGTVSSLEFVKQMVARGANVNARVKRKPAVLGRRFNALGATPFLLAARTADAPLMRLLAQLGANPGLPNDDGTTPLMVAAGVGAGSTAEDPGSEPEMVEAIKVAVELGGDVNAVDKNGDTAMHGVANKMTPPGVGGASLVHLLAERGAKVEVWNRPNKAGLTPIQVGGINGDNIASPSRAAIRELMKAADVWTPTAEPQPRNIGVRIAGSGVVSGTAAVRRIWVDLVFSNTGTGSADRIRATVIQVTTTQGAGNATLVTPDLPVAVEGLEAGGSRTIRIVLDVPTTVNQLQIRETGTFRDIQRQEGDFSQSQTLTP